MWWDPTLGGGQEKPRPQAPADGAGRSVYEDRALAGGESERGWRRIGEIDPDTGLWRDGPALDRPAPGARVHEILRGR